MSLNDKEKEIWDKLENELLAEDSIRKVDRQMGKAATGDPKKLVVGVLLLVAGIVGLIISVINQSIIAGVASFSAMLFGVMFAYDQLIKIGANMAPKNSGFNEAYQNLKKYNPNQKNL